MPDSFESCHTKTVQVNGGEKNGQEGKQTAYSKLLKFICMVKLNAQSVRKTTNVDTLNLQPKICPFMLTSVFCR